MPHDQTSNDDLRALIERNFAANQARLDAIETRVTAVEELRVIDHEALREVREANGIIIAMHRFWKRRRTKVGAFALLILGGSVGPVVTALFKLLGWT